MEVVPKSGDIQTKEHFGDCQLHLEWAAPAEVKGDSQGRGNSGVFLMGLYEIQVLDCYDNPTYADGTTGAIYGQYPPLVNACRKPGEWQTYDIVWKAPRFDGEHLVASGVGDGLPQRRVAAPRPGAASARPATATSTSTSRTRRPVRSSCRTTATWCASATSGTGR